jgi:lantibiotic modifying enzyme
VLSLAGDVVEALAKFIAQDDDYGVQRGAAGAIAALLSFHQCFPAGRGLEVAAACGNHLLASAQILEKGLGWTSDASTSPPLTGFAQGASGIAWALLAVAKQTGEESYRIAGQQALTYERALFSPEAENWPDLRFIDSPEIRSMPGRSQDPVAWCHGAAGIGLSRLSAFQYYPDERLYQEALIALKTTINQGFGQTHCLCHGDMGNLELLLQASLVLGDGKWQSEAERLCGAVLSSIDRYGWYCGGPGGVELPGLMLGIAGIGYQLLRFAAPDQVPSVLTLAAPVQQ